jgi:hypothetical protein
MAREGAAPFQPLLPTPKGPISTGTLSKPTGNGPKPSGLRPKLAAPKKTRLKPKGFPS